MVGCTLPCHLSLVVGDKSAARGGRSATHYEARVERWATDGIEAPNQPSVLPAPCSSAVRGLKDVRRAVQNKARFDGQTANVKQRLRVRTVELNHPAATVGRRQDVASCVLPPTATQLVTPGHVTASRK